ncbi:tetratricopeptide repeat protein [Planctomycetota bacterium]
MLAAFYIEMEEYGDATELLNEYINRYPEEISLRIILGKVQISSGKIEQAVQTLFDIPELEPGNDILRLEIAQYLIDKKLPAEAEQLVRKGFAYPEFVPAGSRFLYDFFYRGAKEIYENPKDARQLKEEMEPLLVKAMALNLADIGADLLYIDFKTNANQFEDADRAWQRILPYLDGQPEIKSGLADFYKKWGFYLWLKKDADRAAEKFELYLDHAPAGEDTIYIKNLLENIRRREFRNNLELLLDTAKTFYDQALESAGKHQEDMVQEALATLGQAEKLDPKHPLVHYFKGLVYSVGEDYARALPCFKTSISHIANPVTMPEAYFHAGKTACRLGDFPQAVDFLNQYLNFSQWLGPDAKPAAIMLFEIARFYRQEEIHAKAADAFDKALGLADIDSAYLHLYYLAAVEFMAVKRFRLARSHLASYRDKTAGQGIYETEAAALISQIDDLVTQSDKTIQQALQDIADKKYDAAEKAIISCLREMPLNPQYHEALGDLRMAQGQSSQAEAAYRKAADTGMSLPAAMPSHFKLAKIFHARGDRAKAKRKLELVISRIPENTPLHQQALELLEIINKESDNE